MIFPLPRMPLAPRGRSAYHRAMRVAVRFVVALGVAASSIAAAGSGASGAAFAERDVSAADGPVIAPDAFGQIGGATTAVAVAPTGAGPVAFVSVGVRVVAYSLRDPSVPHRIGQTGLLPEVPEAIAVENGVLFVGTRAMSSASPAGSGGPARLWTFDVRAADRPAHLASVVLPSDEVGAIAVARDFAYVLLDRGLAVVDVKDPRRPELLATIDLPAASSARTPWHPGAILPTSDDDHLLVAHAAGLFAVDVHDPLAPRATAVDDRPAPAYGIARAGDTAWVTRGPAGIDIVDVGAIVDIDHPDHMEDRPAVIATIPAGVAGDAILEAPTAIAIVGDVAAVVDGGGRRLATWDMRDPRRPRRMESASLAAFPSIQSAVAILGGRAVVALGDAGLRTIDLAAPASPGAHGGPDEAILPPLEHVSVAPPYTYAAAGPAGLYIVHSSADGNRVVGSWRGEIIPQSTEPDDSAGPDDGAGSVDGAGPDDGAGRDNSPRPIVVRSVQHEGGYVYALTEDDGLWTFDVRDPRSPAPAGEPVALPHLSTSGQLAVREGHLFAAAGDGTLRVFDLRDPIRPAQVALRDGFGIVNLALVGRFVYATAVGTFNIGQLHVFNVTEPASPRYIRTHDFNVHFNRLSGADGHLYLTGGYGDLAVLDLTNPSAPEEIARLKQLHVGRAGVLGGRLIVAHPARVEALDIRDPARPRRIGDAIPLPWGRDDWTGTSDVTVADGKVMLLRHEAGLFSLDESQLPRAGRIERFLPLAMIGHSAAAADDGSMSAPPQPPTAAATPPPAPEGSRESCAEPGAAPARITFVVDTSAAMLRPLGADGTTGPTRIAAARSALRRVGAAVAGNPIAIGLVGLDQQAERLPATRDEARLERAIRSMGSRDDGERGNDGWVDGDRGDGIRYDFGDTPRLDLGLAAAARDHGLGLGRAGGLASAEAARRRIVFILAGDTDAATARLARDRAARLRLAGIDLDAVVLGGAGDAADAAGQLAAIVGRADGVRLVAGEAALAAAVEGWVREVRGCGGPPSALSPRPPLPLGMGEGESPS